MLSAISKKLISRVIPIVSGRVQSGNLLMLTRRYVHCALVSKWLILSGVKGQYFDSGTGFKTKVKIELEADSDGPESDDFSQNVHVRFCCILLRFFMYFGVMEGSKSVISKPKPLYLNGFSDF